MKIIDPIINAAIAETRTAAADKSFIRLIFELYSGVT